MPTNRTRRARVSERVVTPKALIYFFETGDHDQSGFAEADRYNQFIHFDNGEDLRNFWNECRERVLGDWYKKHHGTRPFIWWEWEAPKEPVKGWDYRHFDAPQRQRLGGVGTPDYEVLAYAPHFSFGLPTGWVSKFDEEYYNGKRRDIHGNPIGTNFKDGDFKGVAIDPKDPPTFESEAAYLQRHGLLSETEKRYLKTHPELLEPERVN